MTTQTERVVFQGGGEFYAKTRRDVDAYLALPGVRRSALIQLWLKATVGFVLLLGGWTYLVFDATSLGEALPAFASLLVGAIIVSVCLLHDANHGAFFRARWKNYVLAWIVDVVLGFSTYFWRRKHNVHHAFPNVDGLDDDIAHMPLARMSPDQPFRPWYRWQPTYIWILYGLALPRWHVTDLLGLRGTRSLHSSRPNAVEVAGIIGGKLLFVTWVFAIPLTRHGWETVLSTYVVFTVTASFVMAIVFQLAHCVEEADFLTQDEVQSKHPVWAIHEVQSTADFCQANPVITWLFGSLNFQIEHHLFPRIPHTHYPRIAGIVRGNAEVYGVRYTAHSSLRSALRSHHNHVCATSRCGLPVEIEMG